MDRPIEVPWVLFSNAQLIEEVNKVRMIALSWNKHPPILCDCHYRFILIFCIKEEHEVIVCDDVEFN